MDDKEILLMDSVSYIDETARGKIVVSGSHGGSAAACYAAPIKPRLVVFNDAGGGKDDAGVAGLTLLEEAGVAAVAVHHTSARIGEAQDTWEHGVISRVNSLAADMGLQPGMKLQEAAQALRHSTRAHSNV